MRILVLVNHYPLVTDGVGDYTYHWREAMQAQGHEVHIVCRNRPQISKQAQDTHDTQLYPIINNWQHSSTWQMVINKYKALKPDWVVLQYVPYAFHRRGWPWGIVVLLAMLRWLNTARILVFFHEVRTKINPRKPKSWLTGIPMWLVSGGVHWIAQRTATSNHGYARLLAAYGKKVDAVIPVGSNITSTIPNSPFSPLTPNRNAFTIGVFGFGIRGWDIIVPTLKLLLPQLTNLRILVVGQLPEHVQARCYEQITKNGLQEIVTFTGYLPTHEVARQLRKMDLYLMLDPANSSETWTGTSTKSGSLAAALSQGLPIIGTHGELTDPLLMTGAIYLLNELTPSALADVIQNLSQNVALRLYLGQMAQELFISHFRWELIAKRYTDLLYAK